MIKIPSNIDPYADENIKKLSNSSFCEDIFNKVFDYLSNYVNEPGYHNQIKRMRDLQNCMDTAREEGKRRYYKKTENSIKAIEQVPLILIFNIPVPLLVNPPVPIRAIDTVNELLLVNVIPVTVMLGIVRVPISAWLIVLNV